MSKKRLVLGISSIALMCAACGPAHAQGTLSAKQIRIVTSPAGGTADFSARMLAQGLATGDGQQVIVDNRGGANGMVQAQAVMQAPADGSTLLLFSSGLWLLPFLQDNVPYDPVKDFAPISLVDRSPNVLVVHPSLPAKSVRELIALAKAKPGKLNYSRPAAGSPVHLSGELFNAMAGVNIVPIAYKGGGAATLAIAAGEVDVGFVAPTSGGPYIKSKRLRALAVSTAQPSPMFPDLPTVAASGLPGFESVLVNGMFARVGTPASVINRLNQEFVQVLRMPEVKERLAINGAEAVGSSPEELASFVKSDMAKWGKLIKAANIRGE